MQSGEAYRAFPLEVTPESGGAVPLTLAYLRGEVFAVGFLDDRSFQWVSDQWNTYRWKDIAYPLHTHVTSIAELKERARQLRQQASEPSQG